MAALLQKILKVYGGFPHLMIRLVPLWNGIIFDYQSSTIVNKISSNYSNLPVMKLQSQVT